MNIWCICILFPLLENKPIILQESTELEVHLAHGTDYTTIASCKLKFRDIFDKPHGRVHGTADVISEFTLLFPLGPK